jgi:hypothetical protein
VAEENTRGAVHVINQQQFSIHVRVNTGGGCLAGPHVLPQRLNHTKSTAISC